MAEEKEMKFEKFHGEFDPNFRYFGTVKWFQRLKGFGFLVTEELSTDGTENDIFVHYKDIISPYEYKALMRGENVYFNLKRLENGDVVAYNVSKKEVLDDEDLRA